MADDVREFGALRVLESSAETVRSADTDARAVGVSVALEAALEVGRGDIEAIAVTDIEPVAAAEMEAVPLGEAHADALPELAGDGDVVSVALDAALVDSESEVAALWLSEELGDTDTLCKPERDADMEARGERDCAVDWEADEHGL